MKNLLSYSLVFIMLGAFTGCRDKEEAASPAAHRKPAGNPPAVEADSACGTKTVDFIAGQHYSAGNIIITNDLSNVYVTFTATGDWKLRETHLYVGTYEGLPKSNGGNPKIGNFPFKDSMNDAATITYTIPLSSLGEDRCFVVAAHAAVVRLGDNGEVVQAETAWSAGSQIAKGGSWASYTVYCLCDGEGGNGAGGNGSGVGGN